MTASGECPWCVRVTCQHRHTMQGLPTIAWPCQWSGYRRRGDAHKPCPWCGSTVGPFTVASVRHRLSTICPVRKFARGSGPQ